MIDLRLGDCLELMRSIPDASVDAVITDPPYGANIAEWDTASPPQKFVDECIRVTRGAIVMFGSSMPELMSAFLSYSPLPERVLSWSPRWSLAKSVRNRIFYRWTPIFCWNIPDNHDGIHSDIIDTPCEGNHQWNHPATKPLKLMKQLVGLTSEGGTVLDPFMGSGTTGVACVKLNRSFIGIEINPKYFTIAERRIAEAQQQMVLL